MRPTKCCPTPQVYFGEESNDIPPSFDPLDHDWGIALRYYPDLTKLEARLSKISWRLAYSFRAYLLVAKLFDQEPRSLRALEHKFLETYFGTNTEILSFAHPNFHRPQGGRAGI
jgi:hypothetical protein